MRKLKNEELNRLEPEAFKKAEKTEACILLDDIRSLNNVGSVFRTADAFRIEKIWLCGITGKPPHRDINKTALGATETVEWEHRKDIISLVGQLKENGWTICAVEQADKSTLLDEFQPATDQKYAFVFGNEVFGVKEEIVKNAAVVLEIPQYGTKHSLNIAVSVGVITWDFITKTKALS